jgi:hypothetical protein
MSHRDHSVLFTFVPFLSVCHGLPVFMRSPVPSVSVLLFLLLVSIGELSASMSLLAASLVLCLYFCTVRVCLSSSLHDASISLQFLFHIVSHRPLCVCLSSWLSCLFLVSLPAFPSRLSSVCVTQCVSSPLPAPTAILLSSRAHLVQSPPTPPIALLTTHSLQPSIPVFALVARAASSFCSPPCSPACIVPCAQPDHTAAIIVGRWVGEGEARQWKRAGRANLRFLWAGQGKGRQA